MTITVEEVCKALDYDWKWALEHGTTNDWSRMKLKLHTLRNLMIEHSPPGESGIDETDILLDLARYFFEEALRKEYPHSEAA